MKEALVVLGALCVVAAAVGGGVKWAGAELPALRSIGRQALVALVGAGLVGFGLNLPDDKQPAQASASSTTGAHATISIPKLTISVPEVTMTLSRTTGPPGTVVKVTGTGFEAAELVDLRFDTEVLGQVRTDGNGDFSHDVEIPDTPFRNQQHTMSASGLRSARSATRPFQVK